ncbi:MAG: GGDEF domain-containing response regulator [Opitutaceae bacterium]
MPRPILLIDDDRLQFRVTQAHFAAFQNESYELEWAESYEQGLAKLTAGDYAACLLDFQLGERDGLAFIHEAVESGCSTPIVFLTAETADRVDISAMNAGALDYLVKSEITPRMLERSLRYAVKLGDTLAALRRLATRDQLTGLLNRREFERMLDEEQERALRFGHGLALIMIDVDHFKSINDAHGHPAGDAVLREIARRISAQVRTVDRVARVGGEEFGLIMVQSDGWAARQVAERVCEAVRSEVVRIHETLTLRVTISAGVASLPQDAGTATALVAAADRALYAAKAAGRNRVVGSGEL